MREVMVCRFAHSTDCCGTWGELIINATIDQGAYIPPRPFCVLTNMELRITHPPIRTWVPL